VKTYTWSKNHKKYNISWEISEIRNVTVNGIQSYHCSVNGQEALYTFPALQSLSNINLIVKMKKAA